MNQENTINVPVSMETKDIERSLNRLQIHLQSFSQSSNQFIDSFNTISNYFDLSISKFSNLSVQLVGLNAAFSILKNTVSSIASNYIAFTDSISKMSQRTGISTESLSGLKFATEQCGGNFDYLLAELLK